MTAPGTARRVSGKFMTPGVAFGQRDADVVDAEFETLPANEGPARARPQPPEKPAPEGLDVLLSSVRPPRQRGGVAFWSAGMIAVMTAFWVSGGHSAFRGIGHDEAASGFRLSGVSSRVESRGTQPVILVDGRASNGGAADAPVPAIEIRVSGLDGKTLHYKLGTSDRLVAPGDGVTFASRIRVPKNGVKTVTVAFAD